MADTGADSAAGTPSIDSGLAAAETARRLAEGAPDALQRGEQGTVVSIAAEAMLEPMFLLPLAAGALYLAFGDLQEGLTPFGVVLLTLAPSAGYVCTQLSIGCPLAGADRRLCGNETRTTDDC